VHTHSLLRQPSDNPIREYLDPSLYLLFESIAN
jgi:hypothetical protein